jgi:hypothetical protein
MSEQGVHEAVFQWPTKREVNIGMLFCAMIFALSLYTFLHPIAIYLLCGLSVIGVIYFLVALKFRESHYARVLEGHIETGSSFLQHNNSRIEITNIDTVRFTHAMIDNRNYGSVIISSVGGAKLKIQSLQDPEAFVAAINDKKRELESAGTGVARELAALNRLLEQGVISERDFLAGKRKILGK